METAGIILLLLFVFFAVFVSLALMATVRTVRTVKQRFRKGTAQARRVMEDGRLRARRYTVVGPAGELVRLRLELRNSIDSTFQALEADGAEDASLAEAAGLLHRLSDHAFALDTELKMLEQEPDRARIANRLPDLTARAHSITRSADSLRWAAQDRARRFADDELSALTREVDLEAGALRHWAPVESGEAREAREAREAGEVRPGPGPAPGSGLGRRLFGARGGDGRGVESPGKLGPTGNFGGPGD
ncbi:hypothetical protein [Streptomyces sp. NBC_01190]|uniref:hypothetical protein n=1 Tax=Streptomyces sp. NBC_01190 TaxID=2903767 RepID=UPI0038696072|nr:hypothetical protein OG519_09910 [Streptomyces sp. NBC_01190]